MNKSVGHIRSEGLAERALSQTAQRSARGTKRGLGLIADVDPDLDQADLDLRDREARWPLIASLAVIVGLSAGLWLAILALISRFSQGS